MPGEDLCGVLARRLKCAGRRQRDDDRRQTERLPGPDALVRGDETQPHRCVFARERRIFLALDTRTHLGPAPSEDVLAGRSRQVPLQAQSAEFRLHPGIVHMHVPRGWMNVTTDPLDETRPLAAPHLRHHGARRDGNKTGIAIHETLRGERGRNGSSIEQVRRSGTGKPLNCDSCRIRWNRRGTTNKPRRRRKVSRHKHQFANHSDAAGGGENLRSALASASKEGILSVVSG